MELFTSINKKIDQHWKNKKSQTWYIDFIVGIVIFSLALVLFYQFFSNYSSQDKDSLTELIVDAKSISSSLVSAGYPGNWNNDTVERIGLTNNNHRINQTKLDEFIEIPYNKTRNLFGTKFDYWIYFENRNKETILVNNKIGIGQQNYDTKKLARVVRLVVKDSNITRMVIHVWDD